MRNPTPNIVHQRETVMRTLADTLRLLQVPCRWCGKTWAKSNIHNKFCSGKCATAYSEQERREALAFFRSAGRTPQHTPALDNKLAAE